jgi:2-polyprenyl-3-methyl-5-hydroxy-6-metoxy-1,4-benzoquinol methylase
MLLTKLQIEDSIKKLGQPKASVMLNKSFNSNRSHLNSNDVKYLYDQTYLTRVDSHPAIIMLEGKYKINTHNRHTYDYILPRINKNTRILDVGCGKGDFALALSTHNVDAVIGIDFSEESISAANTSLNSSNLPCQFFHCDASDLKHEFQFDFITLNDVFEHLSDDELSNLFINLKNLLSKNGEIIIHTPNGLALCNDTDRTLFSLFYKTYYQLFKNWKGQERTAEQIYYDQVHINIKSYPQIKRFLKNLGFTTKIQYDNKCKWFFLNQFSTHMLVTAQLA